MPLPWAVPFKRRSSVVPSSNPKPAVALIPSWMDSGAIHRIGPTFVSEPPPAAVEASSVSP